MKTMPRADKPLLPLMTATVCENSGQCINNAFADKAEARKTFEPFVLCVGDFFGFFLDDTF